MPGTLTGKTSFTVGTVRTINQGSLRALVEVKLGAIVISGWRVVEAPQARPYVQVPQAEYVTQSGRRAFRPLLTITDPELAEQVKTAVLTAWKRTTGNNSESLFDEEAI